MVRIPGFHPGDPGSIPGRGNYFFFSLPVAPSGGGAGREKKNIFRLLYECVRSERDEEKKYFFSPPVAPSGVVFGKDNTTGQLPGDKKIFFFP